MLVKGRVFIFSWIGAKVNFSFKVNFKGILCIRSETGDLFASKEQKLEDLVRDLKDLILSFVDVMFDC